MRVECQDAIRIIKGYLQNDITYPFFVAANGSDHLRAIVNSIPDDVRPMNMSDYCTTDGLPDEDAVFNDLLKAESSILLKGVGEAATLSGSVNFIRRIAGQTFSQKIVVLCRNQGIELDRLAHQNSKFGETRWCELTSVLDLTIVKVKKDVPLDAIQGFKAILKRMEEHPSGKLYVSTDVPIQSMMVISNSYDALRDEDPSFVIPESALQEDQWKEFFQNRNLEINDPFHWRTYLKYLLRGTESPYFQLVIQHSPKYTDYRKEIFNAILRVPHTSDAFPDLYQERKQFLKLYSDADISEYVRDTLIKDSERIHYLTDNTIIEKHAIIEEIANHGFNINNVEKVYPDLAAYFSAYEFSCDEGELLTKYFIQYKMQKVTNKLEPEFLAWVEELSKPDNRKYNLLPSKNQLIIQKKDQDTGLFWIDALGVEYLGYIKKLAKELGLWININIGRATLPSLTEFNNSFFDEWTGFKCPKEPELDKTKHEGVSSQQSIGPAIHLADELMIIKRCINTIKSCLTDHKAEKFLLVSDHGASRLCVLNQHENRWQINSWRMAEDGKHSGRCCPISDADECPESATQAYEYWVLANYDRFKGGRRANVEVHGGASLEEVVVPVIELSLQNERIDCHPLNVEDNIAIVIKPLDGPTVMSVYCSKASAHLTLKIKGKVYTGDKSETNPSIFKVNLSVHDEMWTSLTVYEAVAFDGDNELTTIRFKVQRTKRTTRNDRDGSDFFG